MGRFSYQLVLFFVYRSIKQFVSSYLLRFLLTEQFSAVCLASTFHLFTFNLYFDCHKGGITWSRGANRVDLFSSPFFPGGAISCCSSTTCIFPFLRECRVSHRKRNQNHRRKLLCCDRKEERVLSVRVPLWLVFLPTLKTLRDLECARTYVSAPRSLFSSSEALS